MDNQPTTPQPINYYPNSSSTPNRQPTISPLHLIIAIGVLIIGIIVIISLIQIFRRNPYGPETKIDNFSKYYNSTPNDTRDIAFTQLYTIIANNLPEDTKIPTSGAKIRKGTDTKEYFNDSKINYYTFIVDIDSIKQSYYVQISWSKSLDADLGGYPIIILCPQPDQLIYEPFDCQDIYTETNETSDPSFQVLPLTVSYYDQKGDYVEYRLKTDVATLENDDTPIAIDIIDVTGGNKTAAINKLSELGLNPDDYIINYYYSPPLSRPPSTD